MSFQSPITANFTPLKYDKFGILRPASIVGDYWSKIPHSGVDLRPHENGGGKEVLAIDDGTVLISTKEDGEYINIKHKNGFSANYVHITRLVGAGATVKKGQIIGSYQSHLHFTLFLNNIKVDPEQYINFTNFYNKAMVDKEQVIKIINNSILSKETKDTLIYTVERNEGTYLTEELLRRNTYFENERTVRLALENKLKECQNSKSFQYLDTLYSEPKNEAKKERVSLNEILLGFSKWGGVDLAVLIPVITFLLEFLTKLPSELNLVAGLTAGSLVAYLKAKKQILKTQNENNQKNN
jgi:hypothetical protein